MTDDRTVYEMKRAAKIDANSRQVGGGHYGHADGVKLQHWDFVRLMHLDYLQGCATKYITRHRNKDGAEGLAKALHYVEKRMEDPALPVSSAYIVKWGILFDFARQNGLTLCETEAIAYIVVGEWEEAKAAIGRVVVATS